MIDGLTHTATVGIKGLTESQLVVDLMYCSSSRLDSLLYWTVYLYQFNLQGLSSRSFLASTTRSLQCQT